MGLLFVALVMLMGAVFHEGGHFVAALYFGEKLVFRFDWDELFGWIRIPSFAWDMPAAFTLRQKKIVAFAGFGVEVAAAYLFFIFRAPWAEPYAAFVLLHLMLYPWYAGKETDYHYV